MRELAAEPTEGVCVAGFAVRERDLWCAVLSPTAAAEPIGIKSRGICFVEVDWLEETTL